MWKILIAELALVLMLAVSPANAATTKCVNVTNPQAGTPTCIPLPKPRPQNIRK